MQVALLRAFWGHRPGKKGFIDRQGRLRLKGSPPAIIQSHDLGTLYRIV